MRKFLKSFPSLRFMLISVVVGMLIGVVLGGGFQPRGLISGAVLGLMFIFMMATRNYDPDIWEEIHNPQAHAMRQQVRKQSGATERLQAIVIALELGDPEKLKAEVHQARQFLESST